MLASDIIGNVRADYNDTVATYRVSDATMLSYMNQGIRQVVKAIPAEFRVLRTVQLAVGPYQSVPSDCAYLFDVTRNRGADGAANGTAIRTMPGTARTAVDLLDPAWRGVTGTTIKEAFIDDPRGSGYEVRPVVPSSPAVWAEMALAAFPAALTATSNTVPVSDRFEMALTYWILHRIYSEETEEGSAAIADSYQKRFFAEMEVVA